MRPLNCTRGPAKLAFALLTLLVSLNAWAGEADALRLEERLLKYHNPDGLGYVTEGLFIPGTDDFIGNQGAADAALWTGHYLAATAFRYAVTRTPEALDRVRSALESIRGVSEISGTGLLARVVIMKDSPSYDRLVGNAYLNQATYHGKEAVWIGHPTRDQYAGVFQGLALAYDLVDDEGVRNASRELINGHAQYLVDHFWTMKSPDGYYSSTFVHRPDMRLSVLQIARHVDPMRWTKAYETERFWHTWGVGVPSWVESQDEDGHYYKFNLNSIYYFNLLRFEEEGSYREAYLKAYRGSLWNVTQRHQNAYFDLLDISVHGRDPERDQFIRDSLDALLVRGFRNNPVDHHGDVPVCDGHACDPIPVVQRPYADFMWQRSPFQLADLGDGSIESPGLDYILIYWMARYYGVL